MQSYFGKMATAARQSSHWMIQVVAAGHPTQCQNSQGTIQQEEINLLFPDCLSPEVAVLTKLILSVHLISVWRKGLLQYLLTACCVSLAVLLQLLHYSGLCCKAIGADYDFMLALWTLEGVGDMRLWSSSAQLPQHVSSDTDNCIAQWILHDSQQIALSSPCIHSTGTSSVPNVVCLHRRNMYSSTQISMVTFGKAYTPELCSE